MLFNKGITMSSVDYFKSVEALNESEIAKFIDAGLCYIELPAEIKQALLQIKSQALDFFHLEKEIKEGYVMQDGNGYLDQEKTVGAQIERYIFRNEISSPDMKKVESQVILVRDFLRQEAFEPLLKQVLAYLDIASSYDDLTDSADQTISMIYYPQSDVQDQ